MRIFLLSILSLFITSYASAQYTLTTEEGEEVSNGETLCMHMNGKKALYEIALTLHTTNPNNFVLKEVSNSAPEGSYTSMCTTPGSCSEGTVTDPVGFDSENKNELHLSYVPPTGDLSEAVICYRAEMVDDATVGFDFCIRYTTDACETGLEKILSNNTLSAYPNPASENVTIQYNTVKKSKLNIYNIVGEKVLEYDLEKGSSSINIDVNMLPSGTYFYSLSNSSKAIKTKRLVIQR